MTATPANSERKTVLLIFPTKNEMYPLSTAAFTCAQLSRKQLTTDYQGALILDGEGNLRKIDHIEVLGPWGESIGRRLLSRLTDAWRIDVRLSEPLSYSLEEIKRLLIDCITSSQSMDTMQVVEFEVPQLVKAIREASSARQLLDILKLPAPEDALDVL